MNTLIELYDERAIENILAPDMFRLGASFTSRPGEIAQDRTPAGDSGRLFPAAGWSRSWDLRGDPVSSRQTASCGKLFTIGERFWTAPSTSPVARCGPLFARQGCSRRKRACLPLHYSRKKNRFYDISGAAADEMPPLRPGLFHRGLLPRGRRHASLPDGGQSNLS